MSKLADYDNQYTRLTLFAEELKEIKKAGNNITEDLIDLLLGQYVSMKTMWLNFDKEPKFLQLVYFQRDQDDVLGFADDYDNVESFCEALDKEGIDYILVDMGDNE